VIGEMAQGRLLTTPKRAAPLPTEVENAVKDLSKKIATAYPNLPNTRWIAMRLLEGDASVIEEIEKGTLGESVHDLRMERPLEAIA
jgi:ferrous iron transport protein B